MNNMILFAGSASMIIVGALISLTGDQGGKTMVVGGLILLWIGLAV